MDDLLRLVAEAKSESLALQTVCAVLICEIAMMDKDPLAKRDRIISTLQGVISGAGMDPASTATVERIATMAEAVLSKRPTQP